MATIHSHESGRSPDDNFVIPETPVCLAIAGSDSSAGAGIQADLKTFTALGVHGLTAVTAVVSETPREVRAILPVPPELLEGQIQLLFETYPVLAAKTGMLPSSEHVARAANLLAAWKRASPQARLVVDPVMCASTHEALTLGDISAALVETLLPVADLVTPNFSEAAVLLGKMWKDSLTAREIVEALAEKLQTSVLLKGGHSQDTDHAVDHLLTPHGGCTAFSVPRLPGAHRLHGTGCTLSAAITAHLARGADLEDAVREAKAHLTACMERARHWDGVSALGTPLLECQGP